MFSKRRVFRPPVLRLGVAVHGIADPQHGLAGLAHGLDGLRQRVLDVLRAEAVDQREPPGLVLRIQRGDQALQPAASIAAPTFTPIGIGDAAEVLDVRAIELRRAHADPRHVRREVVPAVLRAG